MKRQTGFTIVELLIVIVVIAILAAITVVAYNGIQYRSKVSTVKSELNAFNKQVQIFKVDDSSGAYPLNDAGFKQVLIAANLWNTTRASDRTFALCSTGSSYALVSHNYLDAPYKNGNVMQYGTESGLSQYTSDYASGGVLDHICNQVLPASSSGYRRFAHSLT